MHSVSLLLLILSLASGTTKVGGSLALFNFKQFFINLDNGFHFFLAINHRGDSGVIQKSNSCGITKAEVT